MIKNAKFIISITLALAVMFVGVYVVTADRPRHSPDMNQPEPVQQSIKSSAVEVVTVTYTDDGFSPQNVAITKGSMVNFVNKSSIPMWVASDPHPAHTDYPEFDTPKVLGRLPKIREDFSFKFDKAGTWKYHSHTASGDDTEVGVHPGVVTVR